MTKASEKTQTARLEGLSKFMQTNIELGTNEIPKQFLTSELVNALAGKQVSCEGVPLANINATVAGMQYKSYVAKNGQTKSFLVLTDDGFNPVAWLKDEDAGIYLKKRVTINAYIA